MDILAQTPLYGSGKTQARGSSVAAAEAAAIRADLAALAAARAAMEAMLVVIAAVAIGAEIASRLMSTPFRKAAVETAKPAG